MLLIQLNLQGAAKKFTSLPFALQRVPRIAPRRASVWNESASGALALSSGFAVGMRFAALAPEIKIPVVATAAEPKRHPPKVFSFRAGCSAKISGVGSVSTAQDDSEISLILSSLLESQMEN